VNHLGVIRRYVREVLLEEVGRNWQSIETMPMNYLHYPELSVSVVYLPEKSKWMVGIKPKGASQKEYRYFNSQEDAEIWARTRADQLKSIVMNQG